MNDKRSPYPATVALPRMHPPHPATVQRREAPHSAFSRPLHSATTAQARYPHQATGAQPKAPHPATVAQRKASNPTTQPHAQPALRVLHTAIIQRMNQLPKPVYEVGKSWDSLKKLAADYRIEDDMMKWLKIAKSLGMPPPKLGHASGRGGSDKKQAGVTRKFVDQMKEIVKKRADADNLSSAWSIYGGTATTAW